MKHLLTLHDWTPEEIRETIGLARRIKSKPRRFRARLLGKTLLMIFAKPSLRTRLSFDVAMHGLGGHAIFYDLSHSTLGKKESMKDFAKVISRYSDVLTARLYGHEQIEELAEHSDIPVINGLTDAYHPCQILGDLLTIKENEKGRRETKITYLGDANNNVTHSLIIGANKVGMKITVSCPDKKEYMPDKAFIRKYTYKYVKEPMKAVKDADVIYTDTWMSYQIPKTEQKKRSKALKVYQVNERVMSSARPGAVFMHCLPAKRGEEVTPEVLDSKQSKVYEQAENRKWVQMAILINLTEQV